MTDAPSLNQKLTELRESSQATWSQRRLDIVNAMIEELERTHVARALDVGDRAPDFALPQAGSEETIRLRDVLRDGPVVLTFYRGQW